MNTTEKPELNLTECDGNSYFIIARARRVAKRAGWTDKQIEDFSDEAMSGNYDKVIQTCMKYFDVT